MLLVGRQEGHPACKKTEWRGAGVVVCLERGADLHMDQLMPLPLTVSCSSKIQTGFTFLVLPAHLGSPGKRAVKRVRACVYSHTLQGCGSKASTRTTCWWRRLAGRAVRPRFSRSGRERFATESTRPSERRRRPPTSPLRKPTLPTTGTSLLTRAFQFGQKKFRFDSAV